MKTIIEGRLELKDERIAIISSRWNNFIATHLIDGAVDTLIRHGLFEDNLTIVRVPGAFEIPAIANRLIKTKKYDGIVCLGAVIRGATPHFDYISSEVTKGIASLSLEYDVPISFGVLTCDTIEQAIERAGSKAGNKGVESSLALIEMINLYKEIN